MFLTFMLVKIQSFSSSIGAYHCVLGRISAKIGGKLEVKKPKIVNLSRTKGFLHSFNTFSALCFYKCSGFITIIVLDEEHRLLHKHESKENEVRINGHEKSFRDKMFNLFMNIDCYFRRWELSIEKLVN